MSLRKQTVLLSIGMMLLAASLHSLASRKPADPPDTPSPDAQNKTPLQEHSLLLQDGSVSGSLLSASGAAYVNDILLKHTMEQQQRLLKIGQAISSAQDELKRVHLLLRQKGITAHQAQRLRPRAVSLRLKLAQLNREHNKLFPGFASSLFSDATVQLKKIEVPLPTRNLLFTPNDRAIVKVQHPLLTPDIAYSTKPLSSK